MKPIDILNKHNLRRSRCREGIIEVMMLSKVALSENEIRERLSVNYDRTTFYRSFKTLEEKKIIHKIIVDIQFVKYAIGDSVTPEKRHVHFYCNECQTLRCLESIPVQDINLPDGYIEFETEVLIKGTCAICKNE